MRLRPVIDHSHTNTYTKTRSLGWVRITEVIWLFGHRVAIPTEWNEVEERAVPEEWRNRER